MLDIQLKSQIKKRIIQLLYLKSLEASAKAVARHLDNAILAGLLHPLALCMSLLAYLRQVLSEGGHQQLQAAGWEVGPAFPIPPALVSGFSLTGLQGCVSISGGITMQHTWHELIDRLGPCVHSNTWLVPGPTVKESWQVSPARVWGPVDVGEETDITGDSASCQSVARGWGGARAMS